MICRITCRRVVVGLLIAVAGITLLVMLCWKPLVTWRIESLKLPEGCVTVHPARVEISDVCWWHISVLGWGAMSEKEKRRLFSYARHYRRHN